MYDGSLGPRPLTTVVSAASIGNSALRSSSLFVLAVLRHLVSGYSMVSQ